MLIIGGHLTVDASLIEDFYPDVQALSRLARLVDGNLCFDCAVESNATGSVLVFEKWRDKAALDAFIAEPGLAAFFQKWATKMRNTLRKYDAENERGPQA